VPPEVYPGDRAKTTWCQGQIVFYGGSTAAERDPKHIGYPEGYLGDMWLYNISSNTLRYCCDGYAEKHFAFCGLAARAPVIVLAHERVVPSDKTVRNDISEIAYSQLLRHPVRRRGEYLCCKVCDDGGSACYPSHRC
jgi:hypothetical protein